MIAKFAADRSYYTVKILANGYAVLALTLSFIHIVALFQNYGSTWQAWIAPVLIDGFVVIGKLGDRPGLTAGTRKLSRTAAIAAGSLSLAANVLAAKTIGDAVIGVLAVIGFWTAEYLSHKIRKSTAKTATRKAAKVSTTKVNGDAKTATQVAAQKRSAAARKAAATRAANKARKAEQAASLTPRIDAAERALATDTRAYI